MDTFHIKARGLSSASGARNCHPLHLFARGTPSTPIDLRNAVFELSNTPFCIWKEMTLPLLRLAWALSLATCIGAQLSPIPEGVDGPTAQGHSFLETQGIDDVGEVFYYKRSENVSECIQHADARSRVIQICTGRAVFEECLGDVESYYFDDCAGRQCVSRFSNEDSLCLLEKSGVTFELNATHEGWVCSVPPGETGLFMWQTPSWALAIGNSNHFDCLTALPKNTLLERRLTCNGEHPVIEHRLTFDSNTFLKRPAGHRVKCVATQQCGLPTIFAGEVVCYETKDPNNDDGFNSFIQGTSTSDSGAASCCLSVVVFFISFLFSFLSMAG